MKESDDGQKELGSEMKLQNEESNHSNDSASGGNKKQHRRNKNEINRDFVCGWPDCKKQYGTNAALYTHTKNKHKGIEHPNTKRPPSELVAGRKGRPLQSESKGFPLHNNQLPPELKKKLKVIQIWSDSRFIEMIHLIGMYGDLENVNLFTREMEEDMSPIDQNTIAKLIDDIRTTFSSPSQDACPEHIESFLMKASHFWKQKVQEELNYVLLFAFLFDGQRVQTLQNHIQKEFKEKGTFKTFYRLIENKPEKTDFSDFIEKIYKTLSSSSSESNDSDPAA